MLTRRLPAVVYVAVLVLLPVMIVTGAMAAGWWGTTGRHSGTEATARQSREPESSRSAPTAVEDIRGSMTVQEVAEAFPPVSVAEILTAFGAPADTPASTQLKALINSGGGMRMRAFRAWLEKRLAENSSPGPASSGAVVVSTSAPTRPSP